MQLCLALQWRKKKLLGRVQTLARDDGSRIFISLDYIAHNSFTDPLSKQHLRHTSSFDSLQVLTCNSYLSQTHFSSVCFSHYQIASRILIKGKTSKLQMNNTCSSLMINPSILQEMALWPFPITFCTMTLLIINSLKFKLKIYFYICYCSVQFQSNRNNSKV